MAELSSASVRDVDSPHASITTPGAREPEPPHVLALDATPATDAPPPGTVNVRSVSLAVLALLATLAAMQWARAVLIPIFLGVMLTYALRPIVNAAHRWRVPRAISAATLLGLIVSAAGWGVWTLSDPFDALIDKVPSATQTIRQLLREREGPTALDRVQRAAAALEAVADANAASGVPRGATPRSTTLSASRVAPPVPALDIRGYLLSGTLGAFAFLGQMTVVIFIALFLLSAGNRFRHKLVKLAGPRLSQKKVTIETLDEIAAQIQRYLLVQVGVSVVVGIATWLAFYAIGLQQSAVWGVVAGVTNLIPYLGALLVGGGAAVVGLVQFGTVKMALVIGGASFAIHTIVGNLLTPWLTGRASRMSPVAVFIAVLVFGWLWGVWGLLLGVPVLMVLKSVCDRIEHLKPIGELLAA